MNPQLTKAIEEAAHKLMDRIFKGDSGMHDAQELLDWTCDSITETMVPYDEKVRDLVEKLKGFVGDIENAINFEERMKAVTKVKEALAVFEKGGEE